MSQNNRPPTIDPSSQQIKRRMKPEARKLLIAQDAARLFATRGFADVGYRELAIFCDVSEPLLYRYFPTKEDLWQAALVACRNNAISEFMAAVIDEPPSTRSLVQCTVALATEFCHASDDIRTQNRNALHRMVLRSLAEDGSFAKIVTSDLSAHVSRFAAECLRAAEAAGDIQPLAEEERVAFGEFYVNLFFMVGALRLPSFPSRSTRLTDEELITYLVMFQLRALGFSPALVRKELQTIKNRRGQQWAQVDVAGLLLDAQHKR